MVFSERKKLAKEYEKWVSENKDVLDCPLTVISWLVAEGYVGKTKVADLEAKLAEKDKAIENWQTMYQSVMQSCHNSIEEDKRLREQLAEKDKWLRATDNHIKLLKEQIADKNKGE